MPNLKPKQQSRIKLNDLRYGLNPITLKKKKEFSIDPIQVFESESEQIRQACKESLRFEK